MSPPSLFLERTKKDKAQASFVFVSEGPKFNDFITRQNKKQQKQVLQNQSRLLKKLPPLQKGFMPPRTDSFEDFADPNSPDDEDRQQRLTSQLEKLFGQSDEVFKLLNKLELCQKKLETQLERTHQEICSTDKALEERFSQLVQRVVLIESFFKEIVVAAEKLFN